MTCAAEAQVHPVISYPPTELPGIQAPAGHAAFHVFQDTFLNKSTCAHLVPSTVTVSVISTADTGLVVIDNKATKANALLLIIFMLIPPRKMTATHERLVFLKI
jgi:hypothetical protein